MSCDTRPAPSAAPASACSYVRDSKAVYKVAGFWQTQQKREAAAAAGGAGAGGATADAAAEGAAGTGPLHVLVSFLHSLTNADADGRIVVQPPQPPQQAQEPGGGGGSLKFVLLNAAAHFGAVVAAAHAVVLASGTLSPLESVLHLFPGLPPHRLHRFACGHVVGQERCVLQGSAWCGRQAGSCVPLRPSAWAAA